MGPSFFFGICFEVLTESLAAHASVQFGHPLYMNII
jgi:hypothetical protein